MVWSACWSIFGQSYHGTIKRVGLYREGKVSCKKLLSQLECIGERERGKVHE